MTAALVDSEGLGLFMSANTPFFRPELDAMKTHKYKERRVQCQRQKLRVQKRSMISLLVECSTTTRDTFACTYKHMC